MCNVSNTMIDACIRKRLLPRHVKEMKFLQNFYYLFYSNFQRNAKYHNMAVIYYGLFSYHLEN
jgi:hypothetical protein